MAQTTIRTALLGNSEEPQLQGPILAEVGIGLTGVLRRDHDFPGMVLRVTSCQGKRMSEPVEFFIPWDYVVAAFAHESWSPQDIEKRVGFAAGKTEPQKKP